MKRKIYDALPEWKKSRGSTTVMLEGARRVGKSYIVEQGTLNDIFGNPQNLRLKDFLLKILGGETGALAPFHHSCSSTPDDVRKAIGMRRNN